MGASYQDQNFHENIHPDLKNSFEETTIVNENDVEGEMKHMGNNSTGYLNVACQYPCNKCDKQFTDRSNLFRHKKNTHEGIKYPCDDCSYKATRREHLLTHIKAVHEGIKFP